MLFFNYKILEKDYKSVSKYFEKHWVIKKKLGKYFPQWNSYENERKKNMMLKFCF